MIIDSTISVMETNIKLAHRLDEYAKNKYRKNPGWNWPVNRRARIQYRESAIRDFLIKQGKEMEEQPCDYFVFWENDEVIDALVLAESAETKILQPVGGKESNRPGILSPRQQIDNLADQLRTKEEKEFGEHFQQLLEKFASFMQFRSRRSRRDREPSKWLKN